MATMTETAYEVLGVAQDATADQIKEAYQTQVRSAHPDMPNGNADRFYRIQNAYDALKTESARTEYDASLPNETPLYVAPISHYGHQFTPSTDVSTQEVSEDRDDADQPVNIYTTFEKAANIIIFCALGAALWVVSGMLFSGQAFHIAMSGTYSWFVLVGFATMPALIFRHKALQVIAYAFLATGIIFASASAILPPGWNILQAIIATGMWVGINTSISRPTFFK